MERQRSQFTRSLIDRSLAQDSLAEFVRQAWSVVEPHTALRWNWHLDVVCEYLEALAAGDLTRVIINQPPRSGKSLLVSVFWPCWLWIKAPEERLVFASYSAALSVKLSVDRRAVIQSRWYQGHWGARVRLADDANLKTEFSNVARGHMISTSVGASITGKGGNYLVVDDLINPAQAESELEREAALRWFSETLGSRLDAKKTGRIVVIEQRTHQRDLTGTVLSQGDWTHLCLPAEFQRRTVIVLPRSRREVVKNEGDLLWPEREGRLELNAAKAQLGAHAYNSQYLQTPVARGGNLFKREDFGTFTVPPQRFDAVVLSFDTAYGKSQSGDYSAGVVVGHLAQRDMGNNRPGFYVLAVWRGRVPFGELKQTAQELAAQWRPNALLIEDSASGQSLIQELRTNTSLPVTPVRADADKFSRAAAVDPVFSGRLVYLADGAAWVEDFLEEVSGFPSWPHDDQVDAFVQALNWLRHRPAPYRTVIYEMVGASTGRLLYDSGRRPSSDSPRVPHRASPGVCAGCGALIPALAHEVVDTVGGKYWLCGVCFFTEGNRTARDFLRAR